MAQKKDDKPSVDIITPAGRANWPKLNSPDEYKGKFTFNTKLIFDPEEDGLVNKKAGNILEAATKIRDAFAESIREKLSAEIDDAKAAKKGAKAKELEKKLADLDIADIGKMEVNDDDGEETGNLVLMAKANAFYTGRDGSQKSRKITIFDAKGKTLANPPDIGGGSLLKLACSVVPYHMESTNTVGVTFYLNAVQLIELVSFGGQRTASAHGFGEEDGYEAEEEETFGGGSAPAQAGGSAEDF